MINTPLQQADANLVSGLSFEEFLKQFADNGDVQKGAIALWKEAMIQTRNLSENFWRTITFFITVHGAMLAGFIVILGGHDRDWPSPWRWLLAAALGAIGASLSSTTNVIFERHREHYLKMLEVKTLLEDKIGFYSCKPFPGCAKKDLTFQWRVEEIQAFRDDLIDWEEKARWRSGSSSAALKRMLTLISLFYWLVIFAGATFAFAGFSTKFFGPN
jgi:hypothetical protein